VQHFHLKNSPRQSSWQRPQIVKEVKNCRLSIRHFRHVKKRAKAKKALTRLRTIANKLIRELQRKLSTHSLFETYQKDFLFYQKVLAQQPKDKNKITNSVALQGIPGI
jgi:IS5 family transposase